MALLARPPPCAAEESLPLRRVLACSTSSIMEEHPADGEEGRVPCAALEACEATGRGGRKGKAQVGEDVDDAVLAGSRFATDAWPVFSTPACAGDSALRFSWASSFSACFKYFAISLAVYVFTVPSS